MPISNGNESHSTLKPERPKLGQVFKSTLEMNLTKPYNKHNNILERRNG